VALLALVLAGCGEGANAPTVPTFAPSVKLTVQASETDFWLLTGETVQLEATALNPKGKPLPNKKHIEWRSTDPAIATVDGDGLVTAVAGGEAFIIVSLGKAAESIRVAVIPADAVYSVEITPDAATVVVGRQVTLSATLRNRRGAVIATKTPTWTSLDPTIATVSGGVVTGLSAGTARIVAEAEGHADTVSVVVASPGVARVILQGGLPSLPAFNSGCPSLSSDDFKTAFALDAQNNVVTGLPITWTVGPPGVLVQTSRGGLPPNSVSYTAVGAGTGFVEATIGGVTGRTTVSVFRCIAVTVTPDPAAVPTGGTARLTATVRTPEGTLTNPIQGDWSSADPTIAAVDRGGVVTGVRAGTTTVSFTYQGQRGSTTVTVADPTTDD
jgi:uncharacterized protein YjdB